MNIGNPSIFKGPSYSVLYGDGVTKTFTLQTKAPQPTGEFVFLSGIQTTDYSINWITNEITFTVAPPRGTKAVVFFIYSKKYNPLEISDGAVNAFGLADNNLKKFSDPSMIAPNSVFYSINTTDFAKSTISDLGRSLVAATDNASFGNAGDVLVASGSQTITGSKTFTNRPINTRPTVTYISRNLQNVLIFLRDGKLYSITGDYISGTYYNTGSGRGLLHAVPSLGADNYGIINIPSTSPIVKVSTTNDNGYALLQDGSLYTWGFNGAGSAGIGNQNQLGFPVLSTTGVTDIFADHGSQLTYFTNGVYEAKVLIKKTDGYIYGAGVNHNGQLGIGNITSPITTWTQLTGMGTNVVKVFNIGCEAGITVFQKSDDTIWVTGYNNYGQLGTGNTATVSTPVDVTTNWQGGAGWELVHCTGGTSWYNAGTSSGVWDGTLMMLLKNRTTLVTKVLTCGRNSLGQIGDGTTTDRSTPYLVPSSGSVKQISMAGSGQPTIHMLNNDGSLYGWGHNTEGEIGDGSTTNRSAPVLASTNVDVIFSDGMTQYGPSYFCTTIIRKTDGLLYATGYNAYGTCGDGTTVNKSSFTKVMIPGNDFITTVGFASPTNNTNTILAASSSGKLYIWGGNQSYIVTDGSTLSCLTPVDVKIKDEL